VLTRNSLQAKPVAGLRDALPQELHAPMRRCAALGRTRDFDTAMRSCNVHPNTGRKLPLSLWQGDLQDEAGGAWRLVNSTARYVRAVLVAFAARV
jgi:hypothetical protein